MDATAQANCQRSEVGYDEVAAAARTLMKAGQQVTVVRVCGLIQGASVISSYSAVDAHLRKWLQTAEAAPARAWMPPAFWKLQETIVAEIRSARKAGERAANETAGKVIAEESHARKLAEAENARLREEQAGLRRDLECRDRLAKEKDQALSDLRSELAASKAAQQELSSRISEQTAASEAARGREEALQAQLDKLLKSQKTTQELLIRLKAERDQARQEMKRLQAAVENARRELDVTR